MRPISRTWRSRAKLLPVHRKRTLNMRWAIAGNLLSCGPCATPVGLHGSLNRRGGNACVGSADFRPPAATILGQVGEQLVHRLEVGGVDDRTALAPGGHQAGKTELVEMKRERRRGLAQALADLARGQPGGALLHEQAEDLEAGLLRQRAERRDHS